MSRLVDPRCSRGRQSQRIGWYVTSRRLSCWLVRCWRVASWTGSIISTTARSSILLHAPSQPFHSHPQAYRYQYVVRSIDSTPVIITPSSCIRHDSLDVKSRPFRTLCRSAAALSKRALSQSSDRSRSAVFQSPSPSPFHHEWHHLSPQALEME
jgi:hypothetical protein